MPKANEIVIPYDERKIEAMRKFPVDSPLSLDDEIMAAIDEVYRRRVPPEVQFLFGDDVTIPTKRSRKAAKKAPPTPAKPDSGGATYE
ncbi:hypothetical protein LJC32_01185 [Oscillospiraceae bacterium OttesenSCG-928-F05]|nr:hypothetical protein [Oscillospiraceae bacterium OttesenSCG-928-F05]